MVNESDGPYRILHISDVHFGASFDASLWEYISALMEREQPNLVVCTGDIVDHGGLFMLGVARRQLEALVAGTQPPCELRCIPGNHDCGPWGNLNFPPFSTNFAALFGPEPMPVPGLVPTYVTYIGLPWILRWLARPVLTALLYGIKWCTALRRLLWGKKSLAYLPIMRKDDPPQVVLVYLDSNHTMHLATGNVDVRELTRLKSLVLNLRDEKGPRAFAPRIALVHHHPLPIPDSKITEGLTSFEPFLVLRNAGIVLRELNRCDVDLILHGHKHYSSFSRLGYSIDHRVEGEIAVLGAGSAGVTHSEQGRNSVNFIDLFKSGRLTYTSIFFGGGAGEPVTELFRNTRYVHGMEMHKMRVHRRAVERQGQWIARVCHEVTIDARGVAVVSHDVCGLTFERDLLVTALPVYIAVSMGRVPHVTLQLSEKSLRQGHTWVDRPPTPRRRIDCSINLGQPLASASPAADYGYEYVSFNTYAITEWETVRAYERDQRMDEGAGRSPGMECTGAIVRAPIQELVIRVLLPDYPTPPDPTVRVMRWSSYPDLPQDASRQFVEANGGSWIYDADVTEHESGRLTRVGENRWELRVQYPLVGHRYDIKWRVRDAVEAETESQSEILRRGIASSYRATLLGLDESPAHLAVVSEWVDSMRAVVSPEFAPVSGTANDLEVALFAYDDQKQELRLVVERQDKANPSRAAPFVVPLAEGVVGAALKRRAVVFYIDPSLSGKRNDAAYLYDDRPEEEWQEPKWKFVVAFPIFGLPDPLDAFVDGALDRSWSPATIVGVLTLASTAPDSGLVRLTHPLAGAPEALAGGVAKETAPAPRPTPAAVSATTAETPQAPAVAAENPNEGAASELKKEDEVKLTYNVVWAWAHLLLARLKTTSVQQNAHPVDTPAAPPGSALGRDQAE